MKPRVVITGVAGFIGSNLADCLLQKGYAVIGADDLSYGVLNQVPNNVKFHQMDVCSKEFAHLIEPGDFIFHFAAKNCIADCQNDPVETAQINLVGTVNVFQSAVVKKARKVIYAESSAVYEGDTQLPSTEHVTHPESFYAISKEATGLFAQAYYRYYHLNTTALRYFCVYGPRQDYRRTIPPVMSAFILKMMNNEKPIIYGNGEKRRDFIHIDDVNNFHLQCIEDARTDNRVFNLGSGKNFSVTEIYYIISQLMNKKITPIFQNDLQGEAQETLANIDCARTLGWQPQIDIEAGLKSFIIYYRENKCFL